jgi:hypothetical protein
MRPRTTLTIIVIFLICVLLLLALLASGSTPRRHHRHAVPTSIPTTSTTVAVAPTTTATIPPTTTTTTVPPPPPPSPATTTTVPPAPPVVSPVASNPATGVDSTVYAEWTKVAICEEGGWIGYSGPAYPDNLGIDAQNWAAYGGGTDESPANQIRVAQDIEAATGTPGYVPDQDGCAAW